LRITSITPNPASSDVEIGITTNLTMPVVLELMDVSGRVVEQYSDETGRSGDLVVRVDVRGLANGSYVVWLRCGPTTATALLVVFREN
jgi:hypothetical protein